MSRERELMDMLDFLCLELDVARENDYEFMQKHIKRQMAWIARELVEVRDFEAYPSNAEYKPTNGGLTNRWRPGSSSIALAP